MNIVDIIRACCFEIKLSITSVSTEWRWCWKQRTLSFVSTIDNANQEKRKKEKKLFLFFLFTPSFVVCSFFSFRYYDSDITKNLRHSSIYSFSILFYLINSIDSVWLLRLSRMNFNFSPGQAAQGANYANRAMNAFQTAVNIDEQQPQTEGTTFWFRWLIRVVAVTTGACKSSISWLVSNSLFSLFF